MISYSTNLCFPEDFSQFDSIMEGKEISNDVNDGKIMKWIEEGISFLRAKPKERYFYSQSGNTSVVVLSEGDNFKVIVSKNYWERELPIDCKVK